jgi:hypothetical protein
MVNGKREVPIESFFLNQLIAEYSLSFGCVTQGHGVYIDKCKNRYEVGWKFRPFSLSSC